MRRFVLSCVCAGVCFLAVPVFAQKTDPAPTDSAQAPVSRLMYFNGEVRTTAGEPRTGPVLLTFGLYADQTGGAPLWVEQQAVVLDAQGRYGVVLGTLTQGGLPLDIFANNTARWLGVAVDADPEQPRFMLLSVGYALKAADADTIGGKAPAEFVLTTDLKEKVRDVVTGRSVSADGTVTNATTENFILKANNAGDHTNTVAPIFEDASGNVGIGTTAPAARLNVNGLVQVEDNIDFRSAGSRGRFTHSASQFTFRGGANQALSFGSNDHVDQLFITTAGNVGIGTTAPEAKLNVNGLVQVEDNIDFRSGGSRGRFTHSASQFTFRAGANQALSFGANNNVDQLFITTLGNVGIGTSNPSSKFHVNGDATIDGNIGAKYQDVAEWVETSAPLEPGTVVIVDPTQPNRVVPAAKGYDARVAGAVSRQPGLVLGERSDTKAMVAQSGRVRIKADARYGAIKIGDLLVTSPTAGYAMKSKPIRVGGATMHRPGTLLGKALEALPKGKGEILVLLTLQ